MPAEVGSILEEHADCTASSSSDYSAFTKTQKRWIILLVAFAGMFSPLSSFIYLATFLVYFAANVGLAVQRFYPALLVLRMVQSVGSSGE